MTKRASLKGKGANIFFSGDEDAPAQSPVAVATAPAPAPAPVAPPAPAPVAAKPEPKFSAKATFYFTPEQLMAMERFRLTLVSEHGLKVDKSEIMRFALEELIDDLAKHGAKSRVVQHFS